MRILNRLLVYVFVISMLALTSCNKDKKGVFEGRVLREGTRKPVGGVKILINEIYDSGSNHEVRVGEGASDANGYYKIDVSSYCGNFIVKYYTFIYSATNSSPAGQAHLTPKNEKCIIDTEFDILIP